MSTNRDVGIRVAVAVVDREFPVVAHGREVVGVEGHRVAVGVAVERAPRAVLEQERGGVGMETGAAPAEPGSDRPAQEVGAEPSPVRSQRPAAAHLDERGGEPLTYFAFPSGVALLERVAGGAVEIGERERRPGGDADLGETGQQVAFGDGVGAWGVARIGQAQARISK